ncbi:flagellar hook-length control protein FliK [Vibrio vulnificus]|uniref:Flagellar hook-length control protein fliK n=1 Tax=Vibrio vulnificus (strain CMCP6) TaxID=216895 RepID=A0A3Q0L4F4_VIBVU|nr:flagellar hook-length control protein FliK [Vibrio vulnificus]AAO10340.1 Flagellar hook-length control protein fliK [Vibrio vulnificus CMCP6]EGR0788681.1 flagellar hook-length control protein FliK [Vibrio vulnificus]EGR0797190.1 flagellar hook-length control protein FliK [Vibrio vulnificus]EGR0814109.1 flagellar hook-length control protein FliK [Vibrio vulnificus]EGR0826820.1 flagellar hook-length control protein FliK [Vibrio vulnificus]
MNVNLQPVSTTAKTASQSGESLAATTTADSTDSKGFLQTLSEVFSSGKTEADGNIAAKASQGVQSEGVKGSSALDDTAETSEAKVGPSDSSVDEVLELESEADLSSSQRVAESKLDQDSSAVLSSEDDKSNQSLSRVNTDSDVLKGAPAAAKDTVAQDDNAKQAVMQEGSKILGQLEQSNAALKETSGKGLPQNASPDIESSAAIAAASTSVQPQRDALDDEQALIAAQQGQSLSHYSAHLDQQAVSQAQPIDAAHQAQIINAQVAENELPQDWREVMPQPQAGNLANSAALDKDVQPSADMDPQALLVSSAMGVNSVKNSATSSSETPQVVSLELLVVIEQKLAAAQPLSAPEQKILDGLKSGQMVADFPPSEWTTRLPVIAATTQPQLTPSEGGSERHAIDWTSPQSAQPKHQDSAAAKTAGSAALAQAVHTALAQPNTATTVPLSADKAAMVLPDGMTANTIPTAFNPAASPDVAKSQVQSMQAALAAAGLASVKGSSKQTSTEAQGAQPTASLYSAQTVTGQTRAENVAAQQPSMPLTRELANEQVAEKVQMMMSKNLKQLDIRLDPPELGRMQIRMTMNNDIANVHFTVTNPQARDIIEQTLPRLREMLAQQGMQLADSSVQQQASGQQQRQYSADGQGNGQQSSRFASSNEENLEADVKLDLNVTSKRDGISFYA